MENLFGGWSGFTIRLRLQKRFASRADHVGSLLRTSAMADPFRAILKKRMMMAISSDRF